MQLGIIGVAAPDKAEKAKGTLEGITSTPAIPAVKEAVAEVKKKGAQAIVVLAAVGRGEAKRIADDNPFIDKPGALGPKVLERRDDVGDPIRDVVQTWASRREPSYRRRGCARCPPCKRRTADQPGPRRESLTSLAGRRSDETPRRY